MLAKNIELLKAFNRLKNDKGFGIVLKELHACLESERDMNDEETSADLFRVRQGKILFIKEFLRCAFKCTDILNKADSTKERNEGQKGAF